jgi:hypothetical protein
MATILGKQAWPSLPSLSGGRAAGAEDAERGSADGETLVRRATMMHEQVEKLRADAAALKARCDAVAGTNGKVGARHAEAPRPRPVPAAALDGAGHGETNPLRLTAIAMAATGRSREEVDAYLRSSFRVTDTTEILDGVFS